VSIAVFATVLFAAALHAAWNAIVKGAGDPLLTTVLVAAGGALLAVAGLPFLPPPAAASWPFIAGSTGLQAAYLVLVARTYRLADMSLAYPLMRGTAPLLVALASSAFLGQPLSPAGWLGVGVICAGVLAMAARALRGGNPAGVAAALFNALVIAGYTLIDGAGVRRSGSPAAYVLWLNLASGAPLIAWALIRRRAALADYARRHWPAGLAGAVGTTASYGLALWAMTQAPVPIVAALRETAIVFGVAISGLLLRERVGPERFVAACAIAAGAVILRLA
jgi:drug/metabolite transporter (DMT)-like permease